MKLTDEALKELETLLRGDYPNHTFTSQQLLEIGNRLIRGVELIYRPTPSQAPDNRLPDKTSDI